MKSQLRAWLVDSEFQPIVEAASEHNRTVSTLIVLTYDADPLIRWRALDAIGRCAERLCSVRTGMLKNLLRRLFWHMNDESGTVAWHAPEAIGEIVRTDPIAFGEFIPMTVSLLDMEPEDRSPFLPGILYALGRIGETAPDAVSESLTGITRALVANDVQTRAMAVWSLGRIGEREALLQHLEFAQDQSRAIVYKEEQLVTTTVAALWIEAEVMTRKQ